MSLKKLLILLAVFAALSAAVLVKNAAWREEAVDPLTGGTRSLLEEGFSIDAVTGLKVRRLAEGSEELMKFERDEAGEWAISSRFGVRARKEAVRGLLEKAKNLRGEVRSEDDALLADYALTDDKAIHLEMTGPSETKLAHILLSPQRPRGTQNFVRLADSPAVLITDTDLLAELSIFSDTDKLDYHAFADLRVVSIDGTKVDSFELTPPGGAALSFNKAEADAAQVERFFSQVSNLFANDILDPSAYPETFKGSPWLRAVITSEGETKTCELWVGPAGEKMPVKVMPEGRVYEVASSQLESLLKTNKGLFLKAKEN